MTHPEGYTALDLVGFTDRGTYASNVSYVKNDIAHYAGSLYKCKTDDTINVTPGENANWTVFIGEPKSLVERIIAPLEDNPATAAHTTGRQIIYDDYLWEVIDDIAVGDALIDYDVDPTNANIKKALPVETQLLEVKAREGNLATLLTTVKTTLVAAINELVGKIGDLTGLTTTVKTSAVAAINEVDTNADAAQQSANIVQAQVSNSGDAYDPTKAYAVGDLCIYNNVLYRCITACSAGSWEVNQSCFTPDTLVNVGNSMNMETLYITDADSVCTISAGEIQTFQIELIYNTSKDFVIINWLNIRIQNVPERVRPNIEIKNNKLTTIPIFNTSFPHAQRGSASSPVISDGGRINHNKGSDTLSVIFFNFLGNTPAGYIFITK